MLFLPTLVAPATPHGRRLVAGGTLLPPFVQDDVVTLSVYSKESMGWKAKLIAIVVRAALRTLRPPADQPHAYKRRASRSKKSEDGSTTRLTAATGEETTAFTHDV